MTRKSKRRRVATRIINDEAMIPAGWVTMNSIATEVPLDGTVSRASIGGWLSAAHRAGELSAVKLVRTTGEFKTGPVYVPREPALAIVDTRLAEIAARREAKSQRQTPAATAMEAVESLDVGGVAVEGGTATSRLEEMVLLLSDQVIRTALRLEDALSQLSDKVTDNFIGVRERMADLQAAVELCAEANSTVSESDPEDDHDEDGVTFSAPMGNGKARMGLVNRE